MARQTAAEKAEANRANEAARAASEQAELARRKRELTELVNEALGDLLTGVRQSSNLSTSQNSRDALDVALERKPWPPRYSGGGHREGQIAPHKLSIFTWLKAVPFMFEPFMVSNGGKEVPGNFWAMDQADGESVAVISCPCGEEPVVGCGKIKFCEGEECRRVFLYLGGAIRVAMLSDEQLEVAGSTGS